VFPLRAFLFHQVALFAKRTLDPDEILLHVLAVRIAAAGGELAEAAVTDHHVAPALGAEFIERDVWNFFALVETTGSFAIGIAGASHELAEAPPLQDHHATAVLAIFFLGGLLNVGRIQVGEVDRIFFGEVATFRISLSYELQA